MDWNRIETKWYEMARRLRQDLPTSRPVSVKMPTGQSVNPAVSLSMAAGNEQASARAER